MCKFSVSSPTLSITLSHTLSRFGAAALLVCWSRLHIGIHYAGDVVGGATTGVAAALAVRLGYRENSRLDAFAKKIL